MKRVVIAVTLLTLGLGTAQAMPVPPLGGMQDGMVLASGGCPPHHHRGYYDGCRKGGGWSPHGPNRLRRGGPERRKPAAT